MEELKAMFRVCAHIKKDGVRCNSPAMKGMNFCYQHIGGNIRELTRARSIYNGPRLDFVYPGCRQAIQHNFFVIAQAMNDGKIDLQTACAYNRIYSACERNLRRFETLYEKDAERELAPLPEASDSEISSTDVVPLPPIDVIPLPPADVIPTEVTAGNEVEGSAVSKPSDNLGAPFKRSLSGEQTGSTPSPTDVIPSAVDAEGGNEVEGSAVSQSSDNAGAPFKRSLSGEHKTPTHVIPTEVTAGNEVEEPAVSKPNEDLGAPSFRAADRGPHEQVFVRGVAVRERVGDDESQPSETLGAPHLEEMWEQAPEQHENLGAPFKPGFGLSGEQEQPSPTNVTPIEAPTFDIQTIDFKKYDPRFKELERLYSECPDYYDRLRAAIRQIQEEEEQAWRAAGCPPLAAAR